MKCQAVHSLLLLSERPNRLPSEVVAHLRACATCRVWQRRLMRLERNVGLLPVAAAPRGKTEFVRQFLAAPVEATSACDEAQATASESVSVDSSTMFHVRKFDKLTAALRSTFHAPQRTLRLFPAPARRRIAAVLAASLMFLAFGLWTGGPHFPLGKRQSDPLLAQVMRHDVRMAAAQTPRERIETFADLADDLQSVTRELFDAAGPEDLKALAGCYVKVVNEGILPQARALPAVEQANLLKGIAQRLEAAGTEAEQLEKVRPDASAAPLQTIKSTARRGANELLHLGAGERAMNRRPPLPPVLFASLLFADVQGGAPSNATRAKNLQRNVGLIENVVCNSLLLADAQEPLKRAQACAKMVDELAGQIREANQVQDTERALELAEHLRTVLRQGVAANLAAARSAIPNGSADERQLRDLQNRTATQMRELEEELPSGSDGWDDRTITRRAVHDGWDAVDKALKRVKAGG